MSSPLPKTVSYLNKIPNKDYNFYHLIIQEAPVQRSIVLWNLIDFAHVNWMHRSVYHHCKILAVSNLIHLVEFGVNQFFFLKLPIYFKYLMWHEVKPPGTVQHLSISPWGGYTKVEVHLEEFERDGVKHTRLSHHFFCQIPFFLLPFKTLLQKYIEKWSAILWKEDMSMLLRRKQVLDTGFKDHPADLEMKSNEGLIRQVPCLI